MKKKKRGLGLAQLPFLSKIGYLFDFRPLDGAM